jgi:hypothetical protein
MAPEKDEIHASPLFDTRKTGRFAPRESVSLFLTPDGFDVKIRGLLIDVNRLGGLGIFVQSPSPLGEIPISSILKPWRVSRNVKKGTVDFNARFMHVINQTHGGKAGLRFSSLPHRAAVQSPEPTRFLQGTRRKAKRAFNEGRPAMLFWPGKEIKASLLDVGSDDGAGLVIERGEAAKLTWGGLFCDGWELRTEKKAFSCVVQRVGARNQTVTLGLVVPGLASAMNLDDKPAREAASDNQLMELLGDILSRKKPKKK